MLFERFRDLITALKIDPEMETIVRNGIPGKRTGDEWGLELTVIAQAKRTGVISSHDFNSLSPAAKELLPRELVIS